MVHSCVAVAQAPRPSQSPVGRPLELLSYAVARKPRVYLIEKSIKLKTVKILTLFF